MRIGDLVHVEAVAHELDRVSQTVPEGRETRPIQELVLEEEKALSASHAIVSSNIVCPPVVASKGSLHALALCDVELVRRQALL